MSGHERFHYSSLEELKQDIQRLGVDIPVAEEVDCLNETLQIGPHRLPNRLAVLPMEGCDGRLEGSPDELTRRRYLRFARGGAGLLWFEATAVVHEGRANPRQLYLNGDNAASFSSLLQDSLAAAKEQMGEYFRPYSVIQLTHSGRYSKPDGVPRPIVAQLNPWLDTQPVEKIRIITDDEIEALEESYATAAVIAAEIGFDAVDIKACHGYLGAELLSAYSRPGRYGGSFENRTRFLGNVVEKIRQRAGNSLQIAVRLNAYDSVPYPFGWGTEKSDFHQPDYSEPVRLAGDLAAKGVSLINVTCGNPYYNPHVNRPYDIGNYLPPFHPLEGVATLLGAARALQKGAPATVVMATGFSWLRQWGVNVAAACIKQGWFQMAGFGRQSFAYPEFAREVLGSGHMDSSKVCLACSKCTVIMRDGGTAGCVIRDSQTYAPIYRSGRDGKEKYESTQLAENVLRR